MRWFRKPILMSLALVLVWTLWRLAVLWHTGLPLARIHDEFSYLLGADTFAHGRLANPSPALASFFESPHELVHPTYASKYPPGQAMFLALGQVLFGAPFYGVLIGNALMLFTFCLMLFAWVPARWALAVAAMFGLVLSPGMYWTNSYWGGSVAASGGALVLLAIGLARKRQTALAGAVFAVGALLLFWTRPFEGGVFTLVLLIVFAPELWRNRRVAMFATAFAVLAIGGAWTCYDNYAVTGNPLLLPYVLHQKQYNVQPVFWFQPASPTPIYSSSRLAAFHGPNGQEVELANGFRKGWPLFFYRAIGLVARLRWDIGPAFLLALLAPVAWQDPLFRRMAIITGVFFLATDAEAFHYEHYAAPVWAAIALMVALWAERAWNRRYLNLPFGRALVLLAFFWPAIAFAGSTHTAQKMLPRIAGFYKGYDLYMPSMDGWQARRAALIHRLSALDRPQLVIVRYPSPDWEITDEWVYNSADIDGQRVVLAHDLGPEEDRSLLAYYPNRTALLLTFDPVSGVEKVGPYPQAIKSSCWQGCTPPPATGSLQASRSAPTPALSPAPPIAHAAGTGPTPLHTDRP